MIAVAGQGLVSSLGADAGVSSAAFIAGIVKPSVEDDFMVFDEDEGDFLPIISHRVPIIAHGFSGMGRLSQLGVAAFKSLFRNVSKESIDFKKTGVFVLFPCSILLKRIYENSNAKKEGDELLNAIQHSAFQVIEEKKQWHRTLFVNIAKIVGLDIPIENIHVVGGGGAGAALSIEQASKDLINGEFESSLVFAIDSFLDVDFVGQLHQSGRIKHGGNPAGFQAGEAAGVLLLETMTDAHWKKRSVEVAIAATSLQKESNHYFSGETATGDSVAQVIKNVLAHESSPLLLISNQNGEPFRAAELANALVKLKAEGMNVDNAIILNPAESFGETGCASGILSICVATRVLSKKYYNADSAIVPLSSHIDERAAINLVRA